MEGESNEWQRQIEELRKQIAVLKAVAESEKREQEAERKVLKSDLAESLARNEAAHERLRTDMEKNTKWQVGVILGGIAVATGFLALWLQILLRSGG